METITHNINGYEVSFMDFGRGDKRVFVMNPEGVQIYGHRTTGSVNYLETAKKVIQEDVNFRAAFDCKPEIEEIIVAPADKMICLSNRKAEFKAAMLRGLENDLVVERDIDRDSFLVVNCTNSTDYRVRLETRADGKVYGCCECKDFNFRKHICKHIAEVLQESFFGVTESFGVTLN